MLKHGVKPLCGESNTQRPGQLSFVSQLGFSDIDSSTIRGWLFPTHDLVIDEVQCPND
jgi:hypothetical protein